MKRSKRGLAAVLIAAVVIAGNGLPAQAAAKAPKKLVVKTAAKTVDVKGKTALDVSVKPKNASAAVTYKSSSKKIASVSKKGIVTGKKKGKVTITVTSKKNKKLKKKISITVKQLKPKSISLEKRALRLTPGASEALAAEVKPAGVYAPVDWTSSNPSVAAVDGNGRVTAKAAGSAVITAAVREKRSLAQTCTVTVAAPAKAPAEKPAADKSKAEKVAEQMEAQIAKLDADQFTDESWQAVQKALSDLKAALMDAQASQQKIDAAVAALEEAVGNLQEKDSEQQEAPAIRTITVFPDTLLPEGGTVTATVTGSGLDRMPLWYKIAVMGGNLREVKQVDPAAVTAKEAVFEVAIPAIANPDDIQVHSCLLSVKPGETEPADFNDCPSVSFTQNGYPDLSPKIESIQVTPCENVKEGELLEVTVNGSNLPEKVYWQFYYQERKGGDYVPHLVPEFVTLKDGKFHVLLEYRYYANGAYNAYGKSMQLRVGLKTIKVNNVPRLDPDAEYQMQPVTFQ